MRNSITRRTFLATSAAAVCGTATFTPACLADGDRKLPTLNFITVTDTHLGYKNQESATKRWQQAAAEIAGQPGDFVLHLGDVVDGGREERYPEYLEIRQAIKKPVYEIPGNHDPEPLFEKYLRKPIEMSFVKNGVRFLLLNNARTDSHDGFLSKQQLAWLEAECKQAATQDEFLILCLHVPVHSNKHPDRGWYVKPANGQTEFYALMEKHADRVLMLMHGHFHNGIRGWEDRGAMHEICFPSVLYNLNRKLESQNAPGYNLPEFRPGYTQVSLQGSEITLAYKPLGEDIVQRKVI